MRTGFLWVVALSFALTAWILASPVGASPDEPSHIAYAWGVATGQGFGGADPYCTDEPCPRVDFDVPKGLIPEPACYAFKPEVSAGCAGPSVVNPYPSYMTRYPPPYYAIVGTALRLGDAIGMTGQSLGYLGRIASAMISISMLAPAFIVAQNRNRKSLALAIVALLPMALFMIGSVNPSGLEIAAAISAALAAATILNNRTLGSRLLFAYSISWLAWSRPVGWLWAGLLLGTVVLLAIVTDPQRTRKKWRRAITWTEYLAALAIVGAAMWFIYALSARVGVRSLISTMPDDLVERWIATALRWGDMISENLGTLGWLDTQTPYLLKLLSLAAVALISFLALKGTSRKSMIPRVLAAYFATVIVVTTGLMLYQDFLWQGRYVLPPLAAGLVLLGITENRSSSTSHPGLIWIAAFAWVISMASAPWVYTRYALGLERGLRYVVPNLSTEATWAPSVGALGFVAILLVAMIAVPLLLRQSELRYPTSSSLERDTENPVGPATGSDPR